MNLRDLARRIFGGTSADLPPAPTAGPLRRYFDERPRELARIARMSAAGQTAELAALEGRLHATAPGEVPAPGKVAA